MSLKLLLLEKAALRPLSWLRAPGVVFLAALLVAAWGGGPARAARFTLDMYFGVPVNLNSSLQIEQQGQEDLEFTARWKTEPFKRPFYWDVRLAYWRSAQRGWALDFFHHKVILKDPPPEVDYFEYTHGYNMLTVQRLWKFAPNVLSLGAGLMIVNPENSVRGLPMRDEGTWLGRGYHMAGWVFSAGYGRRWHVSKKLFGVLEVRSTLSHVNAPVHGGEASLTHVGFHGLFGVGVDF